MHLILAGAFFVTSSFFISISFIANPTNYNFLSIGLLSALLAALELVTKLSHKSQWSDVSWQTRTQLRIRESGIGLMPIGAVLAIYGLISLNSILVSCPANGCSVPEFWSIYGAYTISFYGGLLIVAVGRVMLLLSKIMPTGTEKWREQLMAHRKVKV
ncbi:MAG: hypothetical protein ACRECH_17225 [Nitrososphaerales archaeon]